MNKISKTTNYLPVKIDKENLPNGIVLCLQEEFSGIAAGRLELNRAGIVACDTDAIGCTVNHISHYLEKREGYYFTGKELKELLSDVIEKSCIMGIEYANDKSHKCEIHFRNSKQDLINKLLADEKE